MQYGQADGVFHGVITYNHTILYNYIVFPCTLFDSFKATMIRLLIPKGSGPAGSWSFSSVSPKMSSQRGQDLPVAWIKWHHQLRTYDLLPKMCSIRIHPSFDTLNSLGRPLRHGPMALWVIGVILWMNQVMESPHVAARIQRISATRTRTHHCSGQASGSTRRDHLTISSGLLAAVAVNSVNSEVRNCET